MPDSANKEVSLKGNPRSRLQRAPTRRGYRVATFADVLKRHGLTMAALASACAVMPGAFSLVANTTMRALAHPAPYLLALAGLVVFFVYWSSRHGLRGGRQCQWIFYLLFISVVEEFTFRLVLPALISTTTPVLAAHVVSNLVFASLHYFTLRWRLVNCVVTFLGGMGLSHLMGQGDLVLVIMVHWLGTFINTPAPPSIESDGAG